MTIFKKLFNIFIEYSKFQKQLTTIDIFTNKTPKEDIYKLAYIALMQGYKPEDYYNIEKFRYAEKDVSR